MTVTWLRAGKDGNMHAFVGDARKSVCKRAWRTEDSTEAGQCRTCLRGLGAKT